MIPGKSRGAWPGGYRISLPILARNRIDVRVSRWAEYLPLAPFKLSANSRTLSKVCYCMPRVPPAPGSTLSSTDRPAAHQGSRLPSCWTPSRPSLARSKATNISVPSFPLQTLSSSNRTEPVTSRTGKPENGLKRTKQIQILLDQSDHQEPLADALPRPPSHRPS